jgi:hypothetical protein
MAKLNGSIQWFKILAKLCGLNYWLNSMAKPSGST